MDTQGKKAVIYARVSTQDQWDHGLSIDGQLARCREYCDKKGFVVVDEIQENYTATKKPRERPQAKRIYELFGEINAVVVWASDRVSRQDPNEFDNLDIDIDFKVPFDYLEFITDGLRQKVYTYLVKSDRIAKPDMQSYLEGMQASQELDDIVTRTSNGRRDKARIQEKWPGTSQVPFGYVKIGYGKDDQTIAIDHGNTAETVRQIFRWYTEDRLSYHAIARKLNDLGIPTPKAGTRKKFKGTVQKQIGKWYHNTVSRVLTFQGYIGTFYYKDEKPGEKIKVDVPRLAFIPESTWNLAQDIRKEKRPGPRSKRDYLLSGRFWCVCDSMLAGDNYKTKSGETRYYKCGRRGHSGAWECDHGYRIINAEKVENLVWQYLLDLVSNAKESAKHVLDAEQARQEQIKPKIAILESTKAALIEHEQKRDRLIERLGDWDEPDMIESINLQIRQQRSLVAAHKAEIEKLESEINASGISDIDETVKQIMGKVKRWGFGPSNTFIIGNNATRQRREKRVREMIERFERIRPLMQAQDYKSRRKWIDTFKVKVQLILNDELIPGTDKKSRSIRISCNLAPDAELGISERSSTTTFQYPYSESYMFVKVLPFD